MEQVDGKIIKKRSTILSNVFRESLTNINSKWRNWDGELLVLHQGFKENQAFGRNFAYKNIFIENFTGVFGSFVSARIYDVDGFNLFAELI